MLYCQRFNFLHVQSVLEQEADNQAAQNLHRLPEINMQKKKKNIAVFVT